jgi:hypothetical protein
VHRDNIDCFEAVKEESFEQGVVGDCVFGWLETLFSTAAWVGFGDHR